MWHDFMEMQVLLRVDFLQTAIVRREEMLQTLYNKGQLRPQVRKEGTGGREGRSSRGERDEARQEGGWD